jgi:hypothetical protein
MVGKKEGLVRRGRTWTLTPPPPKKKKFDETKSTKQGCQIFIGKNKPNGHKIYQMAIKYISNGHKIYINWP